MQPGVPQTSKMGIFATSLCYVMRINIKMKVVKLRFFYDYRASTLQAKLESANNLNPGCVE